MTGRRNWVTHCLGIQCSLYRSPNTRGHPRLFRGVSYKRHREAVCLVLRDTVGQCGRFGLDPEKSLVFGSSSTPVFALNYVFCSFYCSIGTQLSYKIIQQSPGPHTCSNRSLTPQKAAFGRCEQEPHAPNSPKSGSSQETPQFLLYPCNRQRRSLRSRFVS